MAENKRIVLTADRSCDLNDELVERCGVHYIHADVMLDGKYYSDCREIFPDDIYTTFREKKVLPKSSSVNTATYAERFRSWTEQGCEVVHIGLSSGLSASYHNSLLAAQEVPGVYTVDSHNLSSGIGLLVLRAAELIAEGLPAAEVAQRVQAMTSQVQTSFVLDTLEFMHAGGRCSTLAAVGANLLGLRPCIEMDNVAGTLSAGKKYRGAHDKVLVQYTRDRLAKFDNIDYRRIFVTHSGMPEGKIEAVCAWLRENTPFEEIHVTRASCTISTHCGPGCLGVLFMTQA